MADNKNIWVVFYNRHGISQAVATCETEGAAIYKCRLLAKKYNHKLEDYYSYAFPLVMANDVEYVQI